MDKIINQNSRGTILSYDWTNEQLQASRYVPCDCLHATRPAMSSRHMPLENPQRLTIPWEEQLERVKRGLISLQGERLTTLLRACMLFSRPGAPAASMADTEEWDMENVHVDNARIRIIVMNLLETVQQLLQTFSMMKCTLAMSHMHGDL